VTDTRGDHWYRREPERQAWELDQFERHALAAKVSYDEDERLVVSTEVRFRRAPLTVTAVYSHGHPYFPPTIASDRYVLDRHQDPIGKNFCLLEDADEDWRPWFSAAQLIGKGLRRLLHDFEQGAEALSADEADMPEPVSAQFNYDPELVVMVGEPFLAREVGATGGSMTLLRGAGRIRLLASASGIGVLDPPLAARFIGPGGARDQGGWISLEAVPRPEHGYDGILSALRAAQNQPLERLRRRLGQSKRVRRVTLVVGLTFIEEGPTRHAERRTWLFAEVAQRRGEEPHVQRLLQAQALTPRERARRVPELHNLADAHVVIIGAGSLGAPVALELAKAGVGELDLFDNDRYDVNNSVRHILPLSLAGEPKATAVADACKALNPFIEAHAHEMAIGDSGRANALLQKELARATVVIDTTGLHSVGRFLGSRARTAGLTLIVAGVTAGSYGADIFILGPEGPCFNCFVRAQDEGAIPKPPAGRTSSITPIGCRHPAFSGPGFEVTELAAVVSRRAIQATGITAYTCTDSNWIVLDFRGSSHFQEGHLAPLPDCEVHP